MLRCWNLSVQEQCHPNPQGGKVLRQMGTNRALCFAFRCRFLEFCIRRPRATHVVAENLERVYGVGFVYLPKCSQLMMEEHGWIRDTVVDFTFHMHITIRGGDVLIPTCIKLLVE